MSDQAPRDPLGGLFRKAKALVDQAAQLAKEGTVHPVPSPARPPVPPPGPSRSGDAFRHTGKLVTSVSTTPLPPEAVPQDPEAQKLDSDRRLAFVMAYLNDPEALPQFKDAKYVYKLVSDERSYQGARCAALEEELKLVRHTADPAVLVPPEPVPAMPLQADGQPHPDVLAALARNEARRSFREREQAIEALIQQSRDVQTNLFLVLKRVTGVKGRTGGTGFLSPPGS